MSFSPWLGSQQCGMKHEPWTHIHQHSNYWQGIPLELEVLHFLIFVDLDVIVSNARISIWNWFFPCLMQKTETPELVPEDVDPIWSTGTEKILSSGKGIMRRIISLTTGFSDLLCDPRCGPFLLLGALMSFGGVWMRRSQAANLIESQTKKEPCTVVSYWSKNSVFSHHWFF